MNVDFPEEWFPMTKTWSDMKLASSVALGDMRMYGMIMHPHQQILCFRGFHLLQLRCKDGFLIISYIYMNSSI